MNLSHIVNSLWKSSRRTLAALALAASYAVPALPSASCDYTAPNPAAPASDDMEAADCIEGDSFTTESGVRIVWGDDPEMFPEEMTSAPVNAHATPLCWQVDVDRAVAAVLNGLVKYPDFVLSSNLKAVYLIERLKIYDTQVGGTADLFGQRVYIANPYSACWIERVFHAEFSSVLISWHPWNISRWLSENPEDFTYGDDAIAAIREGQVSNELNRRLAEDGFLTSYSMTSVDNDFNAYAQYHFLPEPLLWEIVSTYPHARRKSALMVDFYQALHPQYTNAFFRDLDWCDE